MQPLYQDANLVIMLIQGGIRMKSYMQRLGRSLQLPVAVLPAAALLVGIANYWLSFGTNSIANFCTSDS